MSVPLSVADLVGRVSPVGFSGSRVPAPGAAGALSAVAVFIPPSSPVVVGCARGVDELARDIFPSASIFSYSSGRFGSGRFGFAHRSASCVRASGLWLSFPASPCPVGLVPSPSPSACFCGLGSGTWASAALAVGLGRPVVFWLPPGVVPPLRWGLVSHGGGWWVVSPSSVQLSLF